MATRRIGIVYSGPRRDRYRLARDWWHANPGVRVRLSRQRADDFARIARLGDAWGIRLDDLGASEEMLRWVAGAHGEARVVERERRYQALVALLESPPRDIAVWRAFRALKATLPKVGRAAKRAATLAAMAAAHQTA